MRHGRWGIVAGLGVAGWLVLGPGAQAQGTSATSGSAASGSSTSAQSSDTKQGQEVCGTVQKFDEDSKQLILSNSDQALKLNDQTRVTKNGQPAMASDIHEGDDVRASYSGTGDVLMIDVTPAKTPPGGSGK